MFDTLIIFVKEFLENVDFEKNQQTTKKRKKIPRGQRDKVLPLVMVIQMFSYCISNLFISV